jgi:ferritin-like metal-binding protein YciE
MSRRASRRNFSPYTERFAPACIAGPSHDGSRGSRLLIKECLETLGADPTAHTPGADLVGVESMGLIQAVTDPRTTLAQTLHAALAAELIDNEGWESLIVMAQKMGHDDMAERFQAALDEEGVHLAKVRSWYNSLTMETVEQV